MTFTSSVSLYTVVHTYHYTQVAERMHNLLVGSCLAPLTCTPCRQVQQSNAFSKNLINIYHLPKAHSQTAISYTTNRPLGSKGMLPLAVLVLSDSYQYYIEPGTLHDSLSAPGSLSVAATTR